MANTYNILPTSGFAIVTNNRFNRDRYPFHQSLTNIYYTLIEARGIPGKEFHHTYFNYQHLIRLHTAFKHISSRRRMVGNLLTDTAGTCEIGWGPHEAVYNPARILDYEIKLLSVTPDLLSEIIMCREFLRLAHGR